MEIRDMITTQTHRMKKKKWKVTFDHKIARKNIRPCLIQTFIGTYYKFCPFIFVQHDKAWTKTNDNRQDIIIIIKQLLLFMLFVYVLRYQVYAENRGNIYIIEEWYLIFELNTCNRAVIVIIIIIINRYRSDK